MDQNARIAELEALLARCNPPGYAIEMAPRACCNPDFDETWVWDSCEDDEGYGVAYDESSAREAAWEDFHRREDFLREMD